MPGLARDHQVELPTVRIPLLEGGDLDRIAATPGEFGHPLVHFDAGDAATGGSEPLGRDTGADTDVQHLAGGPAGWISLRQIKIGQGLLGQFGRVVRPGAVVTFGVGAEGFGQLAMPVRHVLGLGFGG